MELRASVLHLVPLSRNILVRPDEASAQLLGLGAVPGGSMTGYRDQLAQALRAVAVTSATSYSWFGRRSRPLPEAVSAALSADTAREYLIGLLEHELYRSFYTQGRPVPAEHDRHRREACEPGIRGRPLASEHRSRRVGARLAS